MVDSETISIIDAAIGGIEINKMRCKDGWLCIGFTEFHVSSLTKLFANDPVFAVFFSNDYNDVRILNINGDDFVSTIDKNKYVGNVIAISDRFNIYYEIIEGIGILMFDKACVRAVEGALGGAVDAALAYFEAEIASIEKSGGHGVEYASAMRKLVKRQ